MWLVFEHLSVRWFDTWIYYLVYCSDHVHSFSSFSWWRCLCFFSSVELCCKRNISFIHIGLRWLASTALQYIWLSLFLSSPHAFFNFFISLCSSFKGCSSNNLYRVGILYHQKYISTYSTIINITNTDVHHTCAC